VKTTKISMEVALAAAWRSGQRLRIWNRKAWVRIPAEYKALGILVVCDLKSMVTVNSRINKCQKTI
jgi:hypothetical protein